MVVGASPEELPAPRNVFHLSILRLQRWVELQTALVEMGFHHVGHAGLELLTSGDLPASASQSVGITGVSHCTWLM
ncbi:Protein GVQW1 [Plecturocebus cupreus]